VYEDGKVVYEKDIQLITDGIADIKAAPASTTVDPGNNDVMYRGDKTAWIKLANTIKLRALLRQSEADNQDFINAEMSRIKTEGTGFLGAGENAFVNPGFSTANMNPFWSAYYKGTGGASSTNREAIRPTIFLLD